MSDDDSHGYIPVTGEFDCTECERRIVQLGGPINEFRLCAACLALPGWFNDPYLRRVIDPDWPN